MPEPIDDDPTLPATLSATGLYADVASKTTAAGVEAFEPSFALWSDGAEKERWVRLPACSVIDATDMDRWAVPVGTKLWKEFRVGGKRIETRFIKRVSAAPDGFVYAAYVWDAAETDATHAPSGVKNANGTEHDVPAAWECDNCHESTPARVLGFSAVQLSHDGPGVTVAKLAADGRLSAPAPSFVVPGDATTRTALGTLHANCGHCHNASPYGVWFFVPFVLELSVSDATVADTGVMQTAVGVPPVSFSAPGVTHRIAPGNASASCVSYRMSVRGSSAQMPPLATEQVDAAGLAAVQAWISGL